MKIETYQPLGNKVNVAVKKHVGGVMVGMFASYAVDRGFDPRLHLDQTKNFGNTFSICCFSTKHAALRSKTGWLRIRIMCSSGDIHFVSSSGLVSMS